MWRSAAVVVAGIVGAGALVIGDARLADREASLAASPDTSAGSVTGGVSGSAAPGQRMRLCIGPARVTLGGQPFARLAFGGEGCRRSVADLIGYRILRTREAAAGSPVTMSSSPVVWNPLPTGFLPIR